MIEENKKRNQNTLKNKEEKLDNDKVNLLNIKKIIREKYFRKHVPLAFGVS